MVNAAGIAGVSQDFNGQGRKLDEVSQSTDQWSNFKYFSDDLPFLLYLKYFKYFKDLNNSFLSS